MRRRTLRWVGAAIAPMGAVLIGCALVASPAGAVGGPGHSGPGRFLFVSTNGTDGTNTCTQPSNPCASIAHAVTVAPSGATVLVEPGTYTTTSVDLSQPITLRALGHVVLTGTGPIFDLFNSTSPSSGVVGVTIQGFDFENVTGTGYNGVITVPGYGAGDVAILDNTFSNVSEEAVGYHGNNGLTSPLGTGWRIVGNTVDGVTGTGRSGMFLGGLSDSVIADNSITDTHHAGILLTANATTPPANVNNLVVGNRVSNVPYEGIQVARGTTVSVMGNDVTDAGTACMGSAPPTACGSPGLSSASALMLFNADQSNITVEGNVATDSYVGLAVGQPPSSGTGPLGTGITVRDNDFSGDTLAGVADYAPTGSTSLVAQYNWWGCRGGPSTAAGGCSGVIGTVTFTPWLTHPPARGGFFGPGPGIFPAGTFPGRGAAVAESSRH